MAKQYQWRAELNFNAGDPGNLSHGVDPSTESNWQTANIGGSESRSYTYWYRDSNTAWSGSYQDILSSRVATSVTQSWSTSVDDRNNLTVTITTTINSVARDDIRHPSGYTDSNTPGRDINIYNSDGVNVFSVRDMQVATAHSLSGTINVGTKSFTIAPGDATVIKPSLTMHNQTVGGSSYDDMWLGIQFRNTLPRTWNATVHYDANGGSGAPSDQVVETENETYNMTISNTVPTWTWHRFEGWATSSSATTAQYHGGDTIALSRSNPTVNLYAVWTEWYRVGDVRYSGVFRTTHRSGGKCHILVNGSWVEMRSIDAGTEGNDPPSRRLNNKWLNQYKIGSP